MVGCSECSCGPSPDMAPFFESELVSIVIIQGRHMDEEEDRGKK
jgi:hypothetical protein